MTDFNGYTFTNLSGGDSISDPDGFTNPSNSTDDNDVTFADLTTLSAGSEITKTLGTTFASETITVVRVKTSTDMNIGSTAYAGEVQLQGFNGVSWIKLLTLGVTTGQTLDIDTLVRGSFTVEGLRVAFISTVDNGNNVDMELFTLSYGTSFTYIPKFLLENFKDGTNIEDLSDKTAISEDHTLTWQAITNLAGVGIAENAYRNLQSNNIFINGVHFVVDEFTDTTGTNNTVNLTTTTARYQSSTEVYTLAVNDVSSGDTTHDPDAVTNPSNAFDNDVTTFASESILTTSTLTKSLGKTFGAKTVNLIYIDITSSVSASVAQNDAFIETFNGSIWSTFSSLYTGTSTSQSFKGTVDISSAGSIQGVRVSMTLDSTENRTLTWSWNLIEYGLVYNSSDVIVIDANTKTLEGTEESITNFADKTIPVNTDITVDITDGTTTLSTQPLNEVIGLDGFSSGTLEETFNLSTSDTSITPEIGGFSSYIK